MIFMLLVFLLASFGLAIAVTVLHIGEPLRNLTGRIPGLRVLFRCPACFGFWVGVGLSWFFISPSLNVLHVGVPHPRLLAAVIDGLMACGSNYILHSLTEWLDPTEEGANAPETH